MGYYINIYTYIYIYIYLFIFFSGYHKWDYNCRNLSRNIKASPDIEMHVQTQLYTEVSAVNMPRPCGVSSSSHPTTSSRQASRPEVSVTPEDPDTLWHAIYARPSSLSPYLSRSLESDFAPFRLNMSRMGSNFAAGMSGGTSVWFVSTKTDGNALALFRFKFGLHDCRDSRVWISRPG